MKGQASYPFSMIEAAVTFLLLIGVAYGGQSYTTAFIKEEAMDLQSDQLQDAAIALDNLPEGETALEVNEYEIKTDGMEISMRYRDDVENRTIDYASYDSLEGPAEYQEFSTICLTKISDNGNTLNISDC